MVRWTKSEDVIVVNVLETSLPRLTTTRLDPTFQSVSKVLCVIDVVEGPTLSHGFLHFGCLCLYIDLIVTSYQFPQIVGSLYGPRDSKAQREHEVQVRVFVAGMRAKLIPEIPTLKPERVN